jgi:hypothetical protein
MLMISDAAKMMVDTSRAITDVAREYGVHDTAGSARRVTQAAGKRAGRRAAWRGRG